MHHHLLGPRHPKRGEVYSWHVLQRWQRQLDAACVVVVQHSGALRRVVAWNRCCGHWPHMQSFDDAGQLCLSPVLLKMPFRAISRRYPIRRNWSARTRGRSKPMQSAMKQRACGAHPRQIPTSSPCSPHESHLIKRVSCSSMLVGII